METYFEALPIELIVKILYNDEISLPEFVEAYPELTENTLKEYTRTYYPEIYKILVNISKDLGVSFKMLLTETLQWMRNTGDGFKASMEAAVEYHNSYLNKNFGHEFMVVTDLTAIILLYKNYKKVYDYMVSYNINKVSGLYGDILKEYPHYPLIYIWIYDMLYSKDYKGMIISDNLDCKIIKDILKIHEEEDYD